MLYNINSNDTYLGSGSLALTSDVLPPPKGSQDDFRAVEEESW
jgi:hypothetical protein